jgi:predicted DCC family thiol-disulfide oxidoreductase YuxK
VIVVYDADCGVCQATVSWLRRRDRRGVLDFVGNDAPQLPEGVSLAETAHTIVVLDGGRKLVRADAMAHLLRELRGWSLLGHAMRAPGLRQLANWSYDRFARNRHRISAALGMRACAVTASSSPRSPTPDPNSAPSGTLPSRHRSA